MIPPLTTRTTGELQTLATNSEPPLVQRTTLPGGTVLAERYRIRELIGEGGMGGVYLATHLTIGKAVAIKVLAPEQMRRPRTVGRFLQEAKAASKIRHENVVDINDYGESDGCAFFVMEYLEGEDLSCLVKREGRLPWSRIKPICTQLLAALAAAHAAGVVHRDIKPHNCFITPRVGNPDFVKVIDFGIAKLNDGSEEQLTRTGAILGTAEYMSPEQGMGAELDGRSDLYSVGIILYRMLTGAVPYKGSNPMSILYQHIHAPRVPPSEACPAAGIGPLVDDLVLKALSRSRDDRFASAEEFAAAIQAIDTLGDGAQRKPTARRFGMGIAAAAVVLVGLGAASWALLSEPPRAEPSLVAASASAEAVPEERALEPREAGDGELAVTAGAGGADARATPDAADSSATPDSDAVANAADTSAAAEVVPDAAADAGEIDTAAQPDSLADDEIVIDDDIAEADPDAADPDGAELPLRRSARAVASRLARVDGKVRACGKAAGLFPGESVGVVLIIAPNGRVQAAKVQGAFSRTGATCIEQAVRSTRFSAAQKLQTVEHRFTL
jgi:tRNA A-37 threonylcarbamoyl transferase component Bud32